jgi:hypothetical protein
MQVRIIEIKLASDLIILFVERAACNKNPDSHMGGYCMKIKKHMNAGDCRIS